MSGGGGQRFFCGRKMVISKKTCIFARPNELQGASYTYYYIYKPKHNTNHPIIYIT